MNTRNGRPKPKKVVDDRIRGTRARLGAGTWILPDGVTRWGFGPYVVVLLASVRHDRAFAGIETKHLIALISPERTLIREAIDEIEDWTTGAALSATWRLELEVDGRELSEPDAFR